PPTSGGVWWHHDAANRRLIVQYDSMPYYSSRNVYEWFQVVIYDTTLAAPDGNSVFTYQYLTANNYASTTTGINDSTTAIGIECLFNGVYHRGSLPIESGRAIKFTTEEPMTGVVDSPKPAGLDRLPLVVSPNPFSRTATVRYSLARDTDVNLRVYDAAGRSVRTLQGGPMRAGSHRTVWNGADDSGRRVAHGVYFVRLDTHCQALKVKVILTD
ncbi:MAG: FlgD immunoglobulin-like domain containing protein, partial [bacterium]